MKSMTPLYFLVASAFAAWMLISTPGFSQQATPKPSAKDFTAYWYHQGAEISRFELKQARYGEIHDGYAVLVFVTEKFDPVAQVKSENPARPDEEIVPILKLNMIKRFTTGIYDYSLMMSVFSPVDAAAQPCALKVTASVQDWCGQTWLQLNRRDGGIAWQGHSYFEKEADATGTVDADFTEDSVWTLLRLAPDRLPLGDLRLVPAAFDSRLMHRDPQALAATAEIEDLPNAVDGRKARRYSLTIPAQQRRLCIDFAAEFPHDIFSWEETLFLGTDKETRTTARRTNIIHSEYWNHHGNADLPARGLLGLDD